MTGTVFLLAFRAILDAAAAGLHGGLGEAEG